MKLKNKRWVISVAIIFLLCFAFVGCSNKKEKSSVETFDPKVADVMLFTKSGVKIDKDIFDDLDYSHTDVPINSNKDGEEYEKKIVDVVTKNNVKAVIISGEDKNLLKAFDDIKKKNPGILTISVVDELKGSESDVSMLKSNPNIDLGFIYNSEKQNEVISEISKNMGVKTLYVYTKAKENSDPKINREIEGINKEAQELNMSVTTIVIPDSVENGKSMDNYLKSEISSKVGQNPSTVGVVGTDPEILDGVLKLSKDMKYNVPGYIIGAKYKNDDFKKVYEDVFNLVSNKDDNEENKSIKKEKSDEEKDPSKMDIYTKNLAKSIDKLGLRGKIGMYPRSNSQVATDMALVISSEIVGVKSPVYTGYSDLFAQVMEFENLTELINKNLNSFVVFENATTNADFFRNITVYPDIF